METIYLIIVIFLLLLAVFDLFVGVSNDAVNFLQSAIGAKVAKFRTVLIIASCGVVIGAVMSTGMMDVARHGIMTPSQYSFSEVMTIFLAVMVTDVLVLDVFNSLGMPTSTTVSLVFELLGGSFAIATLKVVGNGMNYGELLNSDKALSVIIAIFVSVAIAFVFGCIVMWISRLVFTFNYLKHVKFTIAIFGGIAFTVLAYFIFLKGLGKSPYIPDSARDYIDNNINMLLSITFLVSTIFMEILHLCHVSVFKFVVLMGTFALAMAFAGNDLVNFIGVPLAGLSSYQDFVANAHGVSASSFMMTSLMESAKTPPFYLMIAGIIMIVAMSTSKKARNVIKTSVDLSRQDEGDEMFGSSSAARAIVRSCQNGNDVVKHYIPASVKSWINSRFNKNEVILQGDAAFDVVRAAVNLVLSSLLITIGTNHQLPLSTTYVTFMVAMGSSLADRAWSRESAVFRVTGVLSVIGGWFITAGVAFITCAIVCLIMYYGGFVLQIALMALVVIQLIRSSRKFAQKQQEADKDADMFRLMMRTRDPELVWDMLQKHVVRTQSYMNKFALEQYNKIVSGFSSQSPRELRRVRKDLKNERDMLKKYRRQELLGLKRCPNDIALERNTWFHLGMNSDLQMTYSLIRILDPIREHVDNNFNPLPKVYVDEYEPIRREVNDLMKASGSLIETGHYDTYREVLEEADNCREQIAELRKKVIDQLQKVKNNDNMQVTLVYLNLLQETQEFIGIMRQQLRAAKKFMEN